MTANPCSIDSRFVEEDGRLVGVLARADVAQHAEAAATGRMVEEMSE